MKKITIEVQVGDKINIDGVMGLINNSCLNNVGIVNVKLDDIDNYEIESTDFYAFPISDRSNRSDYNNGAIIEIGDNNFNNISSSNISYSAYNYLKTSIGVKKIRCTDNYLTLNAVDIKNGMSIHDTLNIGKAFKLHTFKDMPGVGEIKFLTADEIFDLITYGVPEGDHTVVSTVIKMMLQIESSRVKNGIDPIQTCIRLMDRCCEYLENNPTHRDTAIRCALQAIQNTILKTDLSGYTTKLLSMLEDPLRTFYTFADDIHINAGPNSCRINYISNKTYIIEAMNAVGLVTDLELDAAKHIYSTKPSEYTDVEKVKRCILDAYVSFIMRDAKKFKIPKYATEYFEFSYNLVSHANATINSVHLGYDISVDTENITLELYDAEIKPMLVNLFIAAAKDPAIFKTYTYDVSRMFNALYRVTGIDQMVSDYTNTIAKYIDSQSLKKIEGNIEDIYAYTSYGKHKGLMFNDCDNYKKVKKAIMSVNMAAKLKK